MPSKQHRRFYVIDPASQLLSYYEKVRDCIPENYQGSLSLSDITAIEVRPMHVILRTSVASTTSHVGANVQLWTLTIPLKEATGPAAAAHAQVRWHGRGAITVAPLCLSAPASRNPHRALYAKPYLLLTATLTLSQPDPNHNPNPNPNPIPNPAAAHLPSAGVPR